DAVITHGYPTPPPVAASQVEDLRRSLAIPEAASVFWFVGSFAWTYDLGTVIQAARGLAHRTDVYFVLSGTGDREQAWRTQAAGLPNVRFTGWVDRHTIAVLGRMATAGLLAYVPDAPNSLTNKLFEYLSAGLPVLAGLGGEAQALVRQWGCGLPYRPGDPADLKRVVLALVDDPPLRARLAAGSRHAFATAFSEEVIYPRLVRYLEEQVTANARS
ncbi:MAG TPA: glycosyltransferase, partial [Gemmatimonadales bacterium]|nr:glycosyltransferase [Gemmatimonadales bacterium]